MYEQQLLQFKSQTDDLILKNQKLDEDNVKLRESLEQLQKAKVTLESTLHQHQEQLRLVKQCIQL